MKLRPPLWLLDWAVPIMFGAVLCFSAPLRTALLFGGDEGYELMKAFLVSLGHPLYGEVWNDQPPLHTELLALLFRLFGPSAYVGRLLTVGFAMVLVWLVYQLVSTRSGRAAGLVAVLLLISSSFFLELSVSVMLELPAMTLALAAVRAGSNYCDGRSKWWLVCSGVLFGSALQIKWTAAIFAPALAAEWLVRRIAHRRESHGPPLCFRQRWEPLIWAGTLLAAFGLIAVLFYSPNTLPVFWASHFAGTPQYADAIHQPTFEAESLLNDLGLLIPAALAIVLIAYRRLWQHTFPVVLLATVCLIHFWHRPYWYYYHLHFAIPLAWLGAVGIVEWFRALWQRDFGRSRAASIGLGLTWLGWSMVVSAFLTLAPEKAWYELKRLSAQASAAEDANVVALKQHAAQTRWVFTDRVIYAFWAGLPVPPELAVIPKKRIWSGQITETEIVELLERYQPEQLLLLSPWSRMPQLADYVQEHYRAALGVGEEGVYLRK